MRPLMHVFHWVPSEPPRVIDIVVVTSNTGHSSKVLELKKILKNCRIKLSFAKSKIESSLLSSCPFAGGVLLQMSTSGGSIVVVLRTVLKLDYITILAYSDSAVVQAAVQTVLNDTERHYRSPRILESRS